MQPSADSGLSLFATRLVSLLLAPVLRLKAVLRERGGYGKDRHMVLLESLNLGSRRQLFLVSCDNHRFLIGAGAERVGTLVAVPETVQDAASVHAGATQRQPTHVSGVPLQSPWRRTNAMPGRAPIGLQIVKRPEKLSVSTTGDVDSEHGSETGASRWL